MGPTCSHACGWWETAQGYERASEWVSERASRPLLFGSGIRMLESGLHSCCVFVPAEEGWRCPKCQSPCWNRRSWGTVMVQSQPTLTTSFGPHTEKLQIWPPEHGQSSHFVGHVSSVTTDWSKIEMLNRSSIRLVNLWQLFKLNSKACANLKCNCKHFVAQFFPPTMLFL